MKKKSKEKRFSVKKCKVVFSKGPIHLVDCEVRQGEQVLSRQIIEHPGSVVIIPKTKKGDYILIRQFRFAARGWLWEWPAGGREAGESLRQAASRELTEEIGYKPRKLKKIVSFYPSPGISSEVMHLFLGEGLVPCRTQGDEDEVIEVKTFTSAQIARMIRSGAIQDAKTILGFLLLQARGKQPKSSETAKKNLL